MDDLSNPLYRSLASLFRSRAEVTSLSRLDREGIRTVNVLDIGQLESIVVEAVERVVSDLGTNGTSPDSLAAGAQIELLKLVGDSRLIGYLAHRIPETEAERQEVQEAARTMGQELVVHDVVGPRDIETAFAAFVERRVGAVLVGSGAYLFANREQVLALAARHALPASYSQREFAADGGLMSYGSNQGESYRIAGLYVARILKGDNPANLPVMRSTKLDLIINLRTAKMLGLRVPDGLLAIADEVIE